MLPESLALFRRRAQLGHHLGQPFLERTVPSAKNALEEIRRIVWTPKITMPQLRKRGALVLRKLEGK